MGASIRQRVLGVAVCVIAMLSLVVLCACSSQSYEPEKKAQMVSGAVLHTDGVLRVGVDASNVPYAAESEGNIVGIDVDVAAALADEMGLTLELVDVGANVENAFSQENVDIVMGVKNTSDAYWTSEVYMTSAIALFAPDQNATAPASSKETFKVSAQSSSMSAWQITEKYGESHLISEADLKTAFTDLTNNTANYVAADSTIGSYVTHSLGIEAYPIAVLQEKTSYRIACLPTNTAMQNAINTSLANIQSGGVIGVIQSKWLGNNSDITNLPSVSSKASSSDKSSESTSNKNSSTASTSNSSSN